MPWILIHANGTEESFFPNDTAYGEYVAGNGICEDIRNQYDIADPHGGSFFYDYFDGFMNYGEVYENFIEVDVPQLNVSIRYPWIGKQMYFETRNMYLYVSLLKILRGIE